MEFVTNIKKIDDKLIKRFMKFVRKTPNGCWHWESVKNLRGYGRFWFRENNRNVLCQAHRVSYIIYIGKIRKRMTIHHICRNIACVNPNHLEQKTNIDNIMAGNCVSAVNKRKTHCLNGHEFDKENTYRPEKNKRHCKICRREAVKKHRMKKQKLLR